MFDEMKRWVSLSYRGLCVAALTCTVAGCLKGQMTTRSADGAGGPGGDGANNGADFNNAPGLPSEPEKSVKMAVDPGRTVYSLDTRVAITATVFDEDGSELPDADWSVAVDPGGAAEQLENGRWGFNQEGRIAFEVCADVETDSGEKPCDSRTIVVNDTPPTLSINSPSPGEQVEDDGSGVIKVSGTVSDSFGEPVVFVNGSAVTPATDGSFSAQVTPRFGINHIEVAASDGTHPVTSTEAFDILWAPAYDELSSTQPEVEYDDGVVLRIGQAFVDDGESLTPQADGSFETKDLADVLELVIRHVDLMSQVPDPVVSSSSFTLRVTDIDIGSPRIEGSVTDDGMQLYVQVPNLTATTDGSLTVEGQSVDLDGIVTVKLSAFAALDLTTSATGDPIDVSVKSVDVVVEDAIGQFNDPEATAVFALAESTLRNTVDASIADAVEGAFVDELPDVVSGTIGSLDQVMRNQIFPVDTGLGEPIQLRFDGTIESLDTVHRTHLLIPVRSHGRVDEASIFPQSRGVPVAFPSASPDGFLREGRLQFGLKLAFVNGLLHAAWDAGLLEGDISDLVPAPTAMMSGKLQPVIRPPLLGEEHDVVIEIGQLEVEVEVVGSTDVYGISLSVGVSFVMNGGVVGLEVADQPSLRTWLISSGSRQPLLTADTVKGMLRNQVWPDLESAIANSLAMPLPVPSFGGLDAVAPQLSSFSTEFQMNRDVEVRDGFLVFDTILAGHLPPNP